MTWRPLRGRVIVTRITQVTSDVLIIPDSYKDERSVRTADRGVVLAAGEVPKVTCNGCDGDRGWRCDDHEDCIDPCEDCTLCGGHGGFDVCEPLRPGDEVFYLGPAEKLAIEWQGRTAYAVTYEEVLGVVEP